MPVTDAPVVCSHATLDRIGVAIIAAMLAPFAVGPWFTLPPLPQWWFAPVVSLGVALLVAWLAVGVLVPHYCADAEGFFWRTASGRTHRVPWSSVVAARLVGPSKRQYGATYTLELADRRTLSWLAYRPHAEALYDRVASRLGRGAYRDHGDRVDDGPVRFDYAPTLVARATAIGFGTLYPAGALALAGAGVMVARSFPDVGPAIVVVTVVSLPLVAFAVVFAIQCWALALVRCDAVLTLDPLGLTVTGGPSPFHASWNDLRSVAVHRPGGLSRVCITTTAGEFTTPPTQHLRLVAQLRKYAPPTVCASWDHAEAVARGDVATRVAEDVFRHGLTRGTLAPWAWDALTLIAFGCPFVSGLTMRGDDVPLSVVPMGVTLALMGAGVVLLHRVLRAVVRVTVSPTGCEWRTPRRRRRFAWSDVAAASFPDADNPRLTLRLTDGTRLWCWPEWLAGSGELLATLRERLATVPRGGV